MLRKRAIVWAVCLQVLGPWAASPHAGAASLEPNREERAIARLAKNHRLQGRESMKHDPYLHLVARAKARDMARRNYFGHVDPDGYGPNRVLALTGYRLPDYYLAVNNIESLTAGTNYNTPSQAFQAWLQSPPHRRQLLASNNYFKAQTRYGVGYAYNASSKFKHYYVFLSAPPSEKTLPPLRDRMVDRFLRKTPKQIEDRRLNRK